MAVVSGLILAVITAGTFGFLGQYIVDEARYWLSVDDEESEEHQ